MSTRATIAITDGITCKAIYLHSDGYIAWAGVMLHDHFPTQEKAEELIALGSLFSLRERVAPLPSEEHTFENSVEDVTVAYCRDRGEPLDISIFPDMSLSGDKVFIARLTDMSGGNYAYLFDTRKGEWVVGVVCSFLQLEKNTFPDAKPYVWYPLSNWF